MKLKNDTIQKKKNKLFSLIKQQFTSLSAYIEATKEVKEAQEHIIDDLKKNIEKEKLLKAYKHIDSIKS
jgi:hypothetical protein